MFERKTYIGRRPSSVGSVGSPIEEKAASATVGRARPQALAMPSASGTGLDSALVRQKLINQLAQIEGVDPRVTQAMTQIERHRFVDPALAAQAYEDTSLPIGLGQTISKPSVVARMLSLLLQGRIFNHAVLQQGLPVLRVLEVGTGCGYQAAVMSLLFTEVYSVERLVALHEVSRRNLRELRLKNLHLIKGDGMQGRYSDVPYAGIISAAGGDLAPAWIDQLANGGRIVAPITQMAQNVPSAANLSSASSLKGSGAEQRLMVWDKTPAGMVASSFETVQFVPLQSGIA